VHQTADHRAAVADRRVGHQGQGLTDQWGRGAHGAVPLDPGLTRPGAHSHVVAGHLDGVQLVDAVDVDEMLGRGQPHRHQRHQALSSREHLAVLAERRQLSHRLGHRVRAVVGERGRFQRRPSGQRVGS
jgi:hypothetical protein